MISKALKMEKESKTILSEVIDIIKRGYNPLKIILFGSYAYGTPKEDSDIDLLIIKNTEERSVDRIALVKKLIYNPHRKIPISPLIYTLKELEERLEMEDDFVREIVQKGIILYEKADS